jgi:type II secretory pathway pseudopilin PulG
MMKVNNGFTPPQFPKKLSCLKNNGSNNLRPMTKISKTGAGFTLIETLVYLALFAIFVGGAVVAGYGMLEAGSRDQAKVILQEEGSFLLAKLERALNGAQNISLPPVGSPGSALSVLKYDGTIVAVSLSASFMQWQDPYGSYSLNNSNTQVKNLIFTHTAESGSGINPESLQASFTLTTKTGNGMAVSQDFFMTKYLRK